MNSVIDKIVEVYQKENKEIEVELKETIDRTLTQLVVVSLAAIILAVGLAIFLANKITQPVLILNRVAEKVAQGDLTQEVESSSDDEIGQLSKPLQKWSPICGSWVVSEAVTNVVAVTEENTAATEQMSASTQQVNATIQSITTVTQENAAATEEVNASTEEVTASIQSISASAEQLAVMAENLKKMIEQFEI